ncbi:MAG: PspC domain-containing protein [Phocaeicola sp.]|uniref:PspC domain-containing protein n=1 Tax=Phocaeicola sp. TaxID=2773926 RepID=UPI003FA17A34
MKKNITINLFGTLYSIDEDAYELLKKYEDNMRSYYSRREGGEEIADDVEHRVAELFAELREQGIEAITIEHVEEIIRRIGDPQEMEEGCEDEKEDNKKKTEQKSATASNEEKPVHRLFRDPEDKMIGGVISGITKYFGWKDPLPWRIIFVLLCIFSYSILFWIYIICWALIPEAITAEERLQMKGEPVNPKTINEELMNGINKTKEYVNNPNNQHAARGCLATGVKIILFCIGAFFVFTFGTALIGVLIALITAAIATIFGIGVLGADIPNLITPETYQFISGFPKWTIWAFAISSILVLIIPIILIIRAMFKKPNTPSMTWESKVGVFLTWLIALAIAIACICLAGARIAAYEENYQKIEAVDNTRDGIYMEKHSWDYLDDNGWNIISYVNGSDRIHGWGVDPRTNENTECLSIKGKEGNSSSLKYQLEKTTNVRKGAYRIEAIVYANGQGNAIYALPDDKKITIDIPTYSHSNFANIDFASASKIPYFNPTDTTDWKGFQNSAEEHKWNYVYKEFNVKSDGSLKYGVTNSIDYNYNPWTGGKCDIMDLRLTRIADSK